CAAFDAVWMRLFTAERPFAPRSDLALNESVESAKSADQPQRPRVRRLLVKLLAGLVVSMVAAAIAWWQWPSGKVGSDEGVAPEESPPIAPTADGPVEPVDPSAAGREKVDLGMVLVVGVLLAIGGIRARRRRSFVPGPWRYSLQVPPATRPVLDRDAVVDGA